MELLKRSGFAAGEVSLLSPVGTDTDPQLTLPEPTRGGHSPTESKTIYCLRESTRYGFLGSFWLRDESQHYGFMLHHSPISQYNFHTTVKQK